MRALRGKDSDTLKVVDDLPRCPKCGDEPVDVGGADEGDGPMSILLSYSCGTIWSSVDGWVADHLKK